MKMEYKIKSGYIVTLFVMLGFSLSGFLASVCSASQQEEEKEEQKTSPYVQSSQSITSASAIEYPIMYDDEVPNLVKVWEGEDDELLEKMKKDGYKNKEIFQDDDLDESMNFIFTQKSNETILFLLKIFEEKSEKFTLNKCTSWVNSDIFLPSKWDLPMTEVNKAYPSVMQMSFCQMSWKYIDLVLHNNLDPSQKKNIKYIYNRIKSRGLENSFKRGVWFIKKNHVSCLFLEE